MSMRPPNDDSAFSDTVRRVLADTLRELLSELVEHTRLIDAKLDELARTHLSKLNLREWLTTKEAAEYLCVSPYTVREWCRLGRINAVKTHGGRGNEVEWRIASGELTRYQNEGLLPLKKESDIGRPGRVGDTKSFFTVSEFAKLVGVTELLIRSQCDSGEIAANFVRAAGEAVGHWQIPRKELDRYRRKGA